MITFEELDLSVVDAVIPAKAGIQILPWTETLWGLQNLDSRFRGNDKPHFMANERP